MKRGKFFVPTDLILIMIRTGSRVVHFEVFQSQVLLICYLLITLSGRPCTSGPVRQQQVLLLHLVYTKHVQKFSLHQLEKSHEKLFPTNTSIHSSMSSHWRFQSLYKVFLLSVEGVLTPLLLRNNPSWSFVYRENTINGN